MVWQRIEDVLAQVPYLDELQTTLNAMQASAWLVGGCVRDLLLDKQPADIDITTEDPEPLARRFAGLIDARVVPMDPERGIWRVAISAGSYFDFCRFRDEDITGDLAGRDFTINAIALRIPERENDPGGLVDPFHGIEDLNAGMLRLVDPKAFREDPARILRAFRFMADRPLTVDLETWKALEIEADRLPLVAPERLLAEWWKLCEGPHAAQAISRMNETGVLVMLFPELQPMKGVTQNVYHRYDVWEHTLLAVTLMTRFLNHPDDIFQDMRPEFEPILQHPHRRARLIFLALLHDIGKPATRTADDGKVHFYQHEVEGAQIAADLCHRLRVSNDDTRAITTIIRHHLRPLHLMNLMKREGISQKALIKFFDETGDYALDILALAMADKSAGQGSAAEPDVQEHLRELYRTLFTFYRTHYLPAVEHPLITGSDLVQHLQFSPGPHVGHLLRRARDLQIQGKLTSRADALRWAAKPG